MKNLPPNKIYVTPNFNRRWFSKQIDDESAEYIRKDALLEWAKEVKMEMEKQDKIGAISTGICKGAIWELEEIINKINSL